MTHLARKAIKFGEKRKIRAITRSRPFKITEVGTNRKPVCAFILVINSKYLTTYLVPLRSYRSLLFKFWALRF